MSDFEMAIEYLKKMGIDFCVTELCRGYISKGYAILFDKSIIKFDSNGELIDSVDY